METASVLILAGIVAQPVLLIAIALWDARLWTQAR